MKHGIYIEGETKPHCCTSCFFLKRPYVEDPILDNPYTYKKISRCCLQPDYIEDGYKDFEWLSKNCFSWCPIIEMQWNEQEDVLNNIKEIEFDIKERG